MMGLRNRIAIYGNRSQAEALIELPRLFDFLAQADFRVFIHSRFYDYLEQNNVDLHGGISIDHLPPEVDLVVSIGGDGTILRAARWIGEREIPLLGVNTGHLGFLSSCDITGACQMIEDVCKGNVDVEKRMLLEVRGDSVPENMHYALNEITFMREGTASMISVRAEVNGNFLADYRGDGLIVSTPTGSTAYSLSAGGPVIDPTVNCICLCPVAPHTLTLRPFVAHENSHITLIPTSRSQKFTLSLDERSVVLPAKGEFKISKAPFSVLLIRKKKHGFASILRDKLLWSADSNS